MIDDAIHPVDRLYRGWTISYDPPPIPWRGADWQATHSDYEAWTDEGSWQDNGLSAQAGTLDELRAEIDAIEEERAPVEPTPLVAAWHAVRAWIGRLFDRLESQCSRPVMMALLAVFVTLVVLVLGCCFADAVAGTVSSGVSG